jgi:heme-degrading monooxygenase HmoA
MYARVTRVKGDPSQVDRTVEQLKAQMVPIFKQQPGYLGVISVADRETGEGATTTYWDSMENLRASEAAIFAARDKFAAEQGSEVLSFHRCEFVSRHVKGAAATGTHIRVATLHGVDASIRDRLVERHVRDVAPFVLEQPGALASLLMIDDENGLAFAVSTYDTAAHREAAVAAIDARVAADAERLPLERENQTAETIYADLAVPAPTA